MRLALAGLVDGVDAVSDALLAESVYQMVRGNPLRAASTLEAIAGGEMPPPELDVVRDTAQRDCGHSSPGHADQRRIRRVADGWTSVPASVRAEGRAASQRLGRKRCWAIRGAYACIVERLDRANRRGGRDARGDVSDPRASGSLRSTSSWPRRGERRRQQAEIEQRVLVRDATAIRRAAGRRTAARERRPGFGDGNLTSLGYGELMRAAPVGRAHCSPARESAPSMPVTSTFRSGTRTASDVDLAELEGPRGRVPRRPLRETADGARGRR